MFPYIYKDESVFSGEKKMNLSMICGLLSIGTYHMTLQSNFLPHFLLFSNFRVLVDIKYFV